MNGHKAVRFDGDMDALAMSANSYDSTPGLGGSSLTVVMVARPRGPGKGDGVHVNSGAGLIGGTVSWNPGTMWTLALSESGAVGAGSCTNTNNADFTGWSSVWDSMTNVVDSAPHVVMYTWQSGEALEVNVDGQRTQFAGSLVDDDTVTKTRLILGSNEAKLGFDGDIAEFRIYKGARLSAAEQDTVGRELAAVYGAVYTGAAENSGPEPEPASVPDAVAVWNPDGLSGTPGTTVTDWSSSNETWSFNSTIAHAVHSWATSPSIGTETLNGYKTLYFDGVANQLAMTGNNPTPVSGATDMTVAVVLRPHGWGAGDSYEWRYNAWVVGQSFGSGGQQWAVSYPENALLSGCVGTHDDGGQWSRVEADVPLFYGNEAHVAIMTLKGGESVSINIDGAVKTTTYQIPPAAGIKQTRSLMGVNDVTECCFKGEIAEMRFWKEALTLDQQRALGTQLARKYGLSEDGYVSAQGPFASREVDIAEGAVFDAGGYYRVQAGQVFRGGGDVEAVLKLGADGVIESGLTTALTVDGLVVESGSVLRWCCGADGEHAPTQVNGDVILPQGTAAVEIDSESNAPRGILLAYTGSLIDNGVTWQISGGNSTTEIVHDVENRRLRISTIVGTVLIVQ
ncbi:MAG: hypothetical protein R6V06_08955 [Kiritimatiellia bacterium]